MGVVGGVDKVQIVCPLVRQLLTDVPQAGHRHRLSEILMADFLILAEHTAQGAAGEKDGPRSSGAGDRGLLPVVESRPSQNRQSRHPTQSVSPCVCTERPAAPGALGAEHRTPSFSKSRVELPPKFKTGPTGQPRPGQSFETHWGWRRYPAVPAGRPKPSLPADRRCPAPHPWRSYATRCG